MGGGCIVYVGRYELENGSVDGSASFNLIPCRVKKKRKRSRSSKQNKRIKETRRTKKIRIPRAWLH